MQIQTRWPRSIFDSIFAFAPNRDTLGGTAYLIVENSADAAKDASTAKNLLIDAPAWNDETQEFLQQQGGVQRLFLTHRGGHGKAIEIQKTFGCEIVVQEQEAYLLPNLEVTTFEREMQLSSSARALWTPGHSPGSACLHWSAQGGILFTGRHLLPTAQADPAPLRSAKTFHWPRQIQSTRRILEAFSPESLAFICPGASSGYLRGKGAIDRAYDRLAQLDLDALQQTKVLM
ncbi:MBL fold metallo-hydrolase [Microcoleus sp. FACHB-1515]|uniref:MBL fold metallo-hydrolase n=1 Tax=Cyanophyceae TaxID=3028117 RepID=UPI001684EE70|nr:MBL fold metallo-hydrolase [Microcoleus sp. FACHB-1515]MBD2092185.1 MBL fold metallo-hydrolase [Microcoleus sp. FACHB-1515]